MAAMRGHQKGGTVTSTPDRIMISAFIIIIDDCIILILIMFSCHGLQDVLLIILFSIKKLSYMAVFKHGCKNSLLACSLVKT